MNRNAGVVLAGVAAVTLCASLAVYGQPAAGAAEPGARQGARRGGGMEGPGGHEGRDVQRMLMLAASASWAKSSGDVQGLLDKVLADMTVVQQDEAARLAAFTAYVQAERGTDKQAVKGAREGLKTATEKLRTDAATAREDTQALEAKLRELRPAPAAEGGEPPAPAAAK